jgi:site-specific DNA-methyltransferase (adenine-specific)
VFCNPPYGNKETGLWTEKCYQESLKPNTTVVLLIPARTDRASFHNYIYQKENVEIRFIRGRLKFGDGKNPAPFPSMIVIFR